MENSKLLKCLLNYFPTHPRILVELLPVVWLILFEVGRAPEHLHVRNFVLEYCVLFKSTWKQTWCQRNRTALTVVQAPKMFDARWFKPVDLHHSQGHIRCIGPAEITKPGRLQKRKKKTNWYKGRRFYRLFEEQIGVNRTDFAMFSNSLFLLERLSFE